MRTLILNWVGEDIHSTEPDLPGRRRPPYIKMDKQIELFFGSNPNPHPFRIYMQSRRSKEIIADCHAVIKRTDIGFHIADHSLTGTFVNGKRIEKPTLLNDGDVIAFGHIETGGRISPGTVIQSVNTDLKYKVK